MKRKLSSWALAAALALPGAALMACGQAGEAANEVGNQVEKEADKAGEKIKKEADKAGEKIKKEADKAKDEATDSNGGNANY